MLQLYRDWLAPLDTTQFYVVVALLATVAVVWLIGAWRLVRLRRPFVVTPVSLIRSAAQGYVVLEGSGRSLPGHLLVAPFSGRPCLWWWALVEKPNNEDGALPPPNPGLFESRNSTELFVLDDGTGECIVSPSFATVEGAHRDVWRGNSLERDAIRASFKERRRMGNYRFIERRLEPQDRILAAGEFRTFDGSPDIHDTQRMDQAIRELLSSWKKNQPELKRRFDSNRDGEVDMQEWEVARAEARRTVLQSRSPSPRPSMNMLCRPADGGELLLSNLSRKNMLRRLTALTLLLLCGACLCGTASLYALAQRPAAGIATK